MDQRQFRQCNDMRFCRENINLQTIYSIDKSSAKYENDFFSAQLMNNGKEADLNLIIYKLEAGGFRIRAEPNGKESFRFDLSREHNVIDQDVIDKKDNIEAKFTDSNCVLKSKNIELIINYSPLNIMLIQDSKNVVSMNSNKNFVFEHHTGTKVPDESHNGFTDEIPNGPSAVGIDFSFGSEAFISGFSETAAKTNLDDTIEALLRLFNTDGYEYDMGDHIYGSVPFFIAHSTKMPMTGVFWMNPSDTFVNISSSDEQRNVRMLSEGGFLDYIVYTGSFSEIIDQYTSITGKPMFAPIFALGYHQSRWGYMNKNEIGIVMRSLDEDGFPFDSIWLDIDHLNRKTPFSYSRGFSNIDTLIHDLEENDRYLVRICDPHFLNDPSIQKQSADIIRNKYCVSIPNGSPFIGDVWPGECVFPDFLNPLVRKWWASQYKYGIDFSAPNVFYWNDMNEPSIFKSDQHTFPKYLIHHGKYEDREVHNLYGLLTTASTYDGLYSRNPENDKLRPFILTRSFFSGSQRYAWAWTGDNTATWEHLSFSVPMITTSGICGIPFNGADVGGFLKSPDGVLLSRWFQVGAWIYPFFREHCHHKAARREPFMYDGEEKEAIKRAINDRYIMLPFWYTAMRKTNQTGMPISLPLWAVYPEVEEVQDISDQVIVGESIMVAPVLEDDVEEIEPVFPPGKWYNYRNGELATKEPIKVGLTDIPVFVRGGKIIPTFEKPGKSAIDTLRKNLSLYVAVDEDGKATGEIYLDDGKSYKYIDGEYVHRSFTFDGSVLKSQKLGSQQQSSPEILKNCIIRKIMFFGVNANEYSPSSGKLRKVNDNVAVIVHLSLKLSDDWELKVK